MSLTRPCFALIFAVEGRLALLNLNLKDVVHTADCDLEKIAELTEGYSGADITNVCRCDFYYTHNHNFRKSHDKILKQKVQIHCSVPSC